MMSSLSDKGWAVKSDWAAQDKDVSESKLLDIDIHEFGDKVLPEDLGRANECATLEGPMVLQIQKVKNISAPSDNQRSEHAPRILRLQLTDGVTKCVAIEVSRLSGLSIDTPPGTKIRFGKGKIDVRNGLLILPSDLKVLGGHVPLLVERWTTQRDLGALHRQRAAEDRAPPFRPFKADGHGLKSIESTKSTLKQENKHPISTKKSNGDIGGEKGRRQDINFSQRDKQKKEKTQAGDSSDRQSNNDSKSSLNLFREKGGAEMGIQKSRPQDQRVLRGRTERAERKTEYAEQKSHDTYSKDKRSIARRNQPRTEGFDNRSRDRQERQTCAPSKARRGKGHQRDGGDTGGNSNLKSKGGEKSHSAKSTSFDEREVLLSFHAGGEAKTTKKSLQQHAKDKKYDGKNVINSGTPALNPKDRSSKQSARGKRAHGPGDAVSGEPASKHRDVPKVRAAQHSRGSLHDTDTRSRGNSRRGPGRNCADSEGTTNKSSGSRKREARANEPANHSEGGSSLWEFLQPGKDLKHVFTGNFADIQGQPDLHAGARKSQPQGAWGVHSHDDIEDIKGRTMSTSSWKVGDMCSALYDVDSRWYPAQVVAPAHNGLYAIMHDGYDEILMVPASSLKPR